MIFKKELEEITALLIISCTAMTIGLVLFEIWI